MATVINIDRTLLNAQRLSILCLLHEGKLDKGTDDHLQGVLNLLDEIQDHADYCEHNRVDIELR